MSGLKFNDPGLGKKATFQNRPFFRDRPRLLFASGALSSWSKLRCALTQGRKSALSANTLFQ
ncbi:unnamed protein product [Allacma fusca]|uniref:Uncharacterized protein n=1 Tax=Allacma fusca TaxID=39272 RepID=A0A8J2LF71_9HEXA|nr:unnamed protein product [Allacma fusca]